MFVICRPTEAQVSGVTMRRVIVLSLVLGLLVVATGCETVKGVGRDITSAGEAIEKAAK